MEHFVEVAVIQFKFLHFLLQLGRTFLDLL
jgi:hypothetical protein